MQVFPQISPLLSISPKPSSSSHRCQLCRGFSLASRSSFFTQSDKLPEKQIQPCNFQSKPFLIKNHEHISYLLVPGSYFLFTSYFWFKSYKVALSYWPRAFFHPTYSFLAAPSRWNALSPFLTWQNLSQLSRHGFSVLTFNMLFKKPR